MIPFARIYGNGRDITANLTDRLISIECTDEAGEESDTVTIILDDRPRWNDAAIVALPAIGMVIQVEMGFRGGPSRRMGLYLIDEISVDTPPRTLTVKGRAANMPKSYRTPRTQSYHQKTLGEIISEIAGRNGYVPAIDPAVSGIVIRHIDQRNESDMAFASRLMRMHDGVARPVGGRLAAMQRGTGRSVTGAALPPLTIFEADCASWRFDYSARDEAGESAGISGGGDQAQRQAGDSRLPQVTQFQNPGGVAPLGSEPAPGEKGGVRAFWTDIRTGEKKEVTVGQAPFHDLRYTFHNEAEARAAASAHKNTADRGKASFSCLMAWSPLAQAEARLILADFRAYIPRDWRVKRAVHRFEPGGGLFNTVDAELFQEGQKDTSAEVGSSSPTQDDLIDEDAPQEPVKEGPVSVDSLETNDDLIIRLGTDGGR